MKKRFCALLLISTAALSLTACGSSSSASYSDDAYGSVTLCDYKNLTAEKTVLTVTEDDIDSDIDVMLYDYADFKEVDRPSANGDCITAEITGTKDGDVLFSYTGDSSYDLYLGSEDFGADFDQASLLEMSLPSPLPIPKIMTTRILPVRPSTTQSM